MTYVVHSDVNQEEATSFFMTDTKLALMSLDDADLATLVNDEVFPLDARAFSVRNDDDELCAIIKYDYFTRQSINIHLYVKRRFHHTAEPKEIVKVVKHHIKNQLHINKLLLILPAPCTHVIGFAKKVGFEKEAVMKNSYIWRQQLVDLIVYGIEI